MPDISIQFHSDPNELAALISTWITKFSLTVIGTNLRPFRLVLWDADSLSEQWLDVDRIALFCGSVDLSATSQGEFVDRNPERMVVQIGRVTEQGLAESWLTARDTGLPSFAVWRKIAGELKKATQSGAIAVNRDTGARATLRNHRYTPGAKRLQQEGVEILPFAGTNRLLLGEG